MTPAKRTATWTATGIVWSRTPSFHLEAAKIARAINDKRYDEALRMLGRGTDYSEASIALGLAITQLMKALATRRS